jgi:hypothetical protein
MLYSSVIVIKERESIPSLMKKINQFFPPAVSLSPVILLFSLVALFLRVCLTYRHPDETT